MKKKIAVFLTSILFGLTGIFVPIFLLDKKDASTINRGDHKRLIYEN